MELINQKSIVRKSTCTSITQVSEIDIIKELTAAGFNLVSYKEQSYYAKSINQKTANHGQYKVDLSLDRSTFGLSLVSSQDQQRACELWISKRVDGVYIPVMLLASQKHDQRNVSTFNVDRAIDRFLEVVNSRPKFLADRKQAFQLAKACYSKLYSGQLLEEFFGKGKDTFEYLAINLITGRLVKGRNTSRKRPVTDLRKLCKLGPAIFKASIS